MKRATRSSTTPVAHLADRLLERLLPHHVAALLEDHLALIVHHVVVFQHVLAHVEIAGFDLLLRLFQSLVDPGVDDRLALLQAEPLQHHVHALGPEDAHQVVLQRQEELGAPGIALAAGRAAQLVVDAAALVALGADDVEAAGRDAPCCLNDRHLGADLGFLGIPLRAGLRLGAFLRDAHVDAAAELDVGAAARHIGRDRDGARHAGLGHDIGFLLVEAGVQDGEELGGLAVVGPGRLVEPCRGPTGR